MMDGVVENVITPTLTLFDPTCIDITKVETKFCIFTKLLAFILAEASW
jgi:hypothetical protein